MRIFTLSQAPGASLTVVALVVLSFASHAVAQRVSETINFDESSEDWPHEFCVRFKNYNAFTTVDSGGLSGGGLVPRDFTSFTIGRWLGEAAELDTWFVNSQGEYFDTSVTFYFDPSLVNPNANQRAVILQFGNPHPQYPVSITVHVFKDRYFYVSAPGLLTANMSHPDNGGQGWYGPEFHDGLKEGWYRVYLKFTNTGGAFGDEYHFDSTLAFLGENGLATPETFAIIDASSFDPYLSRVPYFIPAISASKWGGCKVIDSISFSGPDVLYADVTTGLAEEYTDTLLTRCGERIYLPYERQASAKSSKFQSSLTQAKSGPTKDMGVTLRGKKRKSIYFFARNDSRYTNSVTIRQTRAKRGLEVKTYKVQLPDLSIQNVSKKMIGGGFTTGQIRRGGRVIFRVDLRAKPGYRGSSITMRTVAGSVSKINRVTVKSSNSSAR